MLAVAVGHLAENYKASERSEGCLVSEVTPEHTESRWLHPRITVRANVCCFGVDKNDRALFTMLTLSSSFFCLRQLCQTGPYWPGAQWLGDPHWPAWVPSDWTAPGIEKHVHGCCCY